MIQPYGRRLHVRPDPVEQQTTASGLILGDQQQHLVWGTIQAIGDEVRHVQAGQRVLFNLLLGREVGDGYVIPEDACYLTA
jgi:co-chaperonin GroES (HSP10)